MTNYMTVDSILPSYLPYPRFLLETELTQSASLVYALLLGRAMLSQANGWIDQDGKIYVIFSIEHLAQTMGKGFTTIKCALCELEKAGLIERKRRGQSQPNRVYVKLPDSRDTDHFDSRESELRQSDFRFPDGQITDFEIAGKPPTNKNIKLNNKLKERVKCERRIFGHYKNVFLSDSELTELQTDFPDMLPMYIERLSTFMASTGREYKSHAATIRRWLEDDKSKAAPQSYNHNYSVGDDETI